MKFLGSGSPMLALGAALVSSIVSMASIARADYPLLIPKPQPHNSLGQEAGWSSDISGDFSLMGAYMLGERFADSGGAYLFDTGNTHPRQTFRLTGGATVKYTHYGIGPNGTVFAGSSNLCQFTQAQTNGAYLGERVAISSKWVALASYNLGHDATAPHQLANCEGQSGVVPAVFLAKRNASGSAFPYGSLNYNFSTPFRDRVQSMDVSDDDLVLVGDGNGAHIFSYNAATDSWNFNRTALFTEDLNPEFGQIVSIDGDTIVIGNKNESTIYVYRKQGTTWSYLLHYQSSSPGFGRAVDVKDDLIIVGSEDGVDFFGINGTSLDHINGVYGTGVRLVAIAGEYAAGVEDGQETFVWQYHHSPAEGGYYKSGTMAAGPVDLNGNTALYAPDNLNIDGVRVLAGYKGYGNGTNILIGSVIFDSIFPLFTGTNTIDNAEGDRIWRNSGEHDWQRHQGSTSSSGTGPSGGASGSQNYYFVETSQGIGAYYNGDTAILESDYVQPSGRLDFDYHMDGDDMGTLYVEVLENLSGGVWQTIMTIDGSLSYNRSTAWQRRGLALDGYFGPIRLRFRYVAQGGWRGDVGLDNIIINRN